MNDLKTQWKALADAKKINSYDVTSYAIIKAIRARSNDKLEVAKGLLLKAFSPITNKNRLHNGELPFQGLESALHSNYWRASKSFGFNTLTESEQTDYIALLNKLVKEKWEDTIYSYIFTRQDLSLEQQLVQTAHCTMVLGQKVKKHQHDANELHFVVFGVPTHDKLAEKLKSVEAAGVETVKFEESDLKTNQLTSFACSPIRKSRAQRLRLFDNETLLSFS
jgi:hypothetical protein